MFRLRPVKFSSCKKWRDSKCDERDCTNSNATQFSKSITYIPCFITINSFQLMFSFKKLTCINDNILTLNNETSKLDADILTLPT